MENRKEQLTDYEIDYYFELAKKFEVNEMYAKAIENYKKCGALLNIEADVDRCINKFKIKEAEEIQKQAHSKSNKISKNNLEKKAEKKIKTKDDAIKYLRELKLQNDKSNIKNLNKIIRHYPELINDIVEGVINFEGKDIEIIVPQKPWARLNEAEFYEKANLIDIALKKYEALYNDEPTFWLCCLMYTHCLSQNEEYEESVKILNKMISYKLPQHFLGHAHASLGYNYGNMNNKKKAFYHINKSSNTFYGVSVLDSSDEVLKSMYAKYHYNSYGHKNNVIGAKAGKIYQDGHKDNPNRIHIKHGSKQQKEKIEILDSNGTSKSYEYAKSKSSRSIKTAPTIVGLPETNNNNKNNNKPSSVKKSVQIKSYDDCYEYSITSSPQEKKVEIESKDLEVNSNFIDIKRSKKPAKKNVVMKKQNTISPKSTSPAITNVMQNDVKVVEETQIINQQIENIPLATDTDNSTATNYSCNKFLFFAGTATAVTVNALMTVAILRNEFSK